MSYNPDEAAPVVGVSANTIRGWCKTYTTELSAGANPPKGEERRLTQEDVAKLQRVKQWRDERRPPQEIARLLQAAATADDLAHLVIEATTKPQEAQGDDILLPVVLSGIDARFRALETAIDEVRAHQRERVNALVTGIVIGAAIVLIVVAIALNVV